jgi:hypothetical protein
MRCGNPRGSTRDRGISRGCEELARPAAPSLSGTTCSPRSECCPRENAGAAPNLIACPRTLPCRPTRARAPSGRECRKQAIAEVSARSGRRSARRPSRPSGAASSETPLVGQVAPSVALGGCSSHAGGVRCTALPPRVVLYTTCSAQNGPPIRRPVRSVASTATPGRAGPGAGAQPLSTNASTSPSTTMLCALCTAMPMSALR